MSRAHASAYSRATEPGAAEVAELRRAILARASTRGRAWIVIGGLASALVAAALVLSSSAPPHRDLSGAPVATARATTAVARPALTRYAGRRVGLQVAPLGGP